MKIEVGRFYRTRDGRKVRIYAVDGSGRKAIHGALFHGDCGWTLASWLSNGLYINYRDSYSEDKTSPSDIVSEWEEPEDWGTLAAKALIELAKDHYTEPRAISQPKEKKPRFLAYFKPSWWGGPRLCFRREMYGPLPGGIRAKWLDEPEEET